MAVMRPGVMIKTNAELAALCDELRVAGRFALDTEFIGERTYVPVLCLIQVALPDKIALVDPFGARNLGSFWELVSDPGIEKVLHAAREDLRLAYYGGGRVRPVNIFDTQVVAGLVGLPQYPSSYSRLVENLMKVRLSKSETRSDWDRRPLSAEQLRYAADDVRYLLPIADELRARLQRLGRETWVGEEMERFAEPLLYETDPQAAYLRVRNVRGGLTARQTAMLRSLAAWREREAAALDVPVRTVLSDEALANLVQRSVRRPADLARVRGFPQGEEASLGPAILEALDTGRAIAEIDLPPALAAVYDDRSPQDRALADLLYAVGVALCLDRQIAPELALNRADAIALVRGDPGAALLTGWRRQALGEDLRLLAAGSAAAEFHVTADGLRISVTQDEGGPDRFEGGPDRFVDSQRG